MLFHLINIHENIAFIRFIASYPNFQIILTALTLYNFTFSVICIWYVIEVLNSVVWTAYPALRHFLKEPCFVNTVSCVFSHLYYLSFSVSISISTLKRLKRLLDLHMVDIQQHFTSVFFLTSQHLIACASPFHNKNRIAIKMQFDCGGGEDHECSDRWGIISIIFYNKFCSSGSWVVTLANKMIQSSYWNFSVQLILDVLHLFLPDAFNSIW